MVIIRCILILNLLFLLDSCDSHSGSGSSSIDTSEANVESGLTPGAVKDLKATYQIMPTGKWKVTLTWTNQVNVKNYAIKRGIAPGVYDDTYLNVTSPYTISNLEAGTTQYFIIILTASVNNTEVSVTSKEYSVAIPLDLYTEKPSAFTMSTLAGDGEVSISWTNAERASFYVIQSGTSSGVYPTVLTRVGKSPYIDKNLTNGATRYYIVIAVNSVGSTNATEESVATPLPAPGSFGTVTASTADRSVRLSWGSSTGADHYNVKRSLNSSGPFTTIKERATSPFDDTDLNNGTLYYYIVSAVSGSLTTDSSLVSAIPMALPDSFSVSIQAGNSQVQLTWADSLGASSYTVQYGLSSGSYSETASNSASSPFTVTGLTNNTLYYFQVSAVNSSGATNASEVSETPIGPSQTWGILQLSDSDSTVNGVGNTIFSDGSANIFVQGEKGSDYPATGNNGPFLMKLNSSGVKQLENKVSSSGTYFDLNIGFYAGMTTDVSGNMFIIGANHSDAAPSICDGEIQPSGDYGAYLLKYNSSGTLSWCHIISTGQSWSWFPVSITSDGTNIYVSASDLSITKFDNDGTLVWNNIMPHGIHTWIGKGLVVLGQSIYFAGQAVLPLGPSGYPEVGTGAGKMFLAKFSITNGDLEAFARFGPESTFPAALALQTDGTNIFVAGYTPEDLGAAVSNLVQDGFIAKLSADLATNYWISQLHVDNELTAVNAFSLDQDGNVYAAGYTTSYSGSPGLNGNAFQSGTTGEDYFVIKLNPLDGSPVWTKEFGSTDYIDSSGYSYSHPFSIWSDGTDVFVTGYTNGARLGTNPLSTITTSKDIKDLFISKHSAIDGSLK